MRIGFLGAGYVARRHAKALVEGDLAEVVGVVDPLLEARAEFGRVVSRPVDAYATVHDLLAQARPDAVWVCLPPDQRGEPELRLVELGVPFFAEKPLAVNLEVARDIATAVEQSGVTTAVGYHWRHLSGIRIAQEQLASRLVHLAVAQWHDGLPGQSWWATRERSGGQVVEQLTHLLDVCRLFMGEPVGLGGMEVARPTTAALSRGGDVPAATAGVVAFQNGGVASVSCSYAMHRRHRVQIELISDELSLVLSEEDLTVTGPGEVRRYSEEADVFSSEVQNFLEAIREGRPVVMSYAEALKSHELAVKLAEASRLPSPRG
ncbi:Gfo/Idh/MocA family oxidoreductase [Geodermatophilus sp. DF01-2]|uniref:Gfo/Idh/MocA family protein n=1 Tax=Geodermatophilus sp. DF01-2 TaxID=2559610 RepID=UPI0032AED9FA